MTTPIHMLLALAASTLALPLAAQGAADAPPPEPLPDLSAMDAREIFALFSADESRWMREPCTFGVPVTAAIDAKTGGALPVRRLKLIAEAFCADAEQRFDDGAAIIAQIAAITPDDPPTALALYFANRRKDAEGALTILRGMERPGFEELDDDTFYALGRMIAAAGRDDEFDAIALEWVDAGKLPFLDTRLHPAVAMRALAAAAAAGGRADVVDQLLLPITNPASYIVMLTDRDYEPFWPQIERRAGPNLTLVGAEHVTVTRTRLTNAPTDRDRFSEAAHALHFNGQFADAIALAQRWRERAERGVGIEEGDAWALNIQAYAHDSLGQRDKADAVFDELAKLDPAQHDWVVNFVINRAARLTGQGRWAQGLAATDLARAVADKQGTTYAKLIIASNRACAYERLGEADKAAPELAYLRENWKDGPALTVRGLMCHGLRDEAAALLLEGLRDKAVRDLARGAFYSDELDLFYTATILPQASDLLPDYPELAAELARHMRPMPEAFIPQAALKRVALKEGAGE
jgi:tetratricopeptide (TPR) repeat protein